MFCVLLWSSERFTRFSFNWLDTFNAVEWNENDDDPLSIWNSINFLRYCEKKNEIEIL